MLAITMFAVFPCSRLFVFCRKRPFVAICAMLGCFFCGAVVAAPGQLDPSFGSAGVVYPVDFTDPGFDSDVSGRLSVSATGESVVVGTCIQSGQQAICAKRYSDNGLPDVTFGVAGTAAAAFPTGNSMAAYAQLYGWPSSTALPDGKIVAVASCRSLTGPSPFYGWCMARFLATGALDTTFNPSGPNPGAMSGSGYFLYAAPIVVGTQSNSKIVLAGKCGTSETFCVTRLNLDGSLDTSFASAANGIARAMPFGSTIASASATVVAIDSLDRIVVAGTCRQRPNYNPVACVGRLSANGGIDNTFTNPDPLAPGSGSWFVVFTGISGSASGNNVALQSDGRMLIIGDCDESPVASTCITRLLASGSPDTAFGGPGRPGTAIISAPDGFMASRSLTVQTNGKIVFAGQCSSLFSLFCVGRLNADGSLDTTFDESTGNGIVQLAIGPGAGYATDIRLNSGGNIVLSGSCRAGSSAATGCVARLLGGSRDASACAVNADGNSTIESSTDALLILRYLLGYRGSALTDGALGANPKRTGQALEDYLGTLNLDADGDGQALAMTDGLLMLRAMLGLTGASLTQGATNASHPNVRNAQQILTWIENTHGVACLS